MKRGFKLVLILLGFLLVAPKTSGRTIGVQTLGDYTHESVQEKENGPITHTFTGPNGFNQTLVTDPDVNNVASLSDPSGVTFTISTQDGRKEQTIGPLKPREIKVSSASSSSHIKISGRDDDGQVLEISAPNPHVFEPCFPFCKEEVIFIRKPSEQRTIPRRKIIIIDDEPEPVPSTRRPKPIIVLSSTERPPPAVNILKDCFPFCSKK